MMSQGYFAHHIQATEQARLDNVTHSLTKPCALFVKGLRRAFVARRSPCLPIGCILRFRF